MTPNINIVRVPDWGFEFVGRDGAGYYGARFCLCLGPYLIFVGSLTEAERDAWHEANQALHKEWLAGGAAREAQYLSAIRSRTEGEGK